MLNNTWVPVPGCDVLYRVRHRVMEGGCQVEHGPLIMHSDGFEILKYPVTNAEYVRFVLETGYRGSGNFLKHLLIKGYDNLRQMIEGIEHHPVTWVSLEDARAYSDYVGAALPTELEWYIAAGGRDGRSWPWGNEFHPNYVNGNGGRLMNVDAHPDGASPFGVEDMVGNCWEWVGKEISDGKHRFAILRGGTYYRAEHFWHMEGGAHPIDSHIKMPLFSGNLNRSATVGFRLVRRANP